MNLEKIVSITGKPGLYRIIAETPSRFVVENVEEPRKKLSIGTNYQVAPMAKITLFTTTDEDPTIEQVLSNMKEKEEELPVPNSNENPQALKTYFQNIVPQFDENRVYPSDFKKIIKWYNILVKVNSEK